MAVKLTNKEQEIFEAAKEYALKYIQPIDEELENSMGELPRQALDHLAQHGYYGIGIKKEMGGQGHTFLESALIYEGLAHGGAGLSSLLLLLNNVSYGLMEYCTHSESVKKLLPDIACGKKTIAFAFTEKGCGSDPSSNTTYAELKDDGYHIFGEKAWILNTKYADHLLVTVNDPQTGKMIMLLVDKGTKGMTCGENIPRMGSNVMYCSTLTFDDCVVPKDRLISEDAYRLSLKFIDIPRVFVPATCVGIAQRSVDLTVDYLSNRKGYAGKPLISNQGLQWQLADFTTEIDAARWLAYRTAQMFDDNDPDASFSAAKNKLFAPELTMKVTTQCVQMWGAKGYARNSMVSRFMDTAKMLTIVDGTSEIQRFVIGRKLLNSAKA